MHFSQYFMRQQPENWLTGTCPGGLGGLGGSPIYVYVYVYNYGDVYVYVYVLW